LEHFIREINPEECKETMIRNKENVSRERALIRYQIWSNVRNRSKNDRLGKIWLIVNPLVTSLIYVFVFTVIRANMNTMNLIIGITIYGVFSVSVRSGVSSIKDYRGGIYAERISTKVLVLGMLGNRIINTQFQTIGAAIVLIFIFDIDVLTSLSLILISTIFGIIVEGFMLNFAKLIRNIPDLNNIIQHTIQLLFYASPVLYSFDQTNGLHRLFNSYNPIMYFIEFHRGLINERFAFGEINQIILLIIISFLIIMSIRGYKTIDRVRWELSTWS